MKRARANTGQLMNITGTINGLARNETYTYDDLGRLASASGFYAQRNYSYDRWGNRTGVTGGSSQSITLQVQQGAPAGVPNNRIATVNGVGYTYDAAGNLTYDGAHSYQYDGEGRIANVDATGATYNYDSANRRLKKVVGTTTTYYIWEGSQVIAEYSNAPAGTGGTSYYLADRLSNRMITDGSGVVKGTQDHLPYGEEGGITGTSDKHRFTSYARDNETGSDYAVNRQYASGVGRFNRADPRAGSTGNPQSLNRYAYVGNDPVNFVDPLGLFRRVCFGNYLIIVTIDTRTGEVVNERNLGFIPDFCVDLPSFDSSDQPRTGGKGRKGAGRVNTRVLFECIQKLFGVDTQAFVPSQKGKSGSYVGLGPSIGKGGNNDAIEIVNDITTFSVSQLTAKVNASFVAAGKPPLPQGERIVGDTVPAHPFTNFTANDLNDQLKILETQVHELGNSLSIITGASNNESIKVNGDPDAGAKLEDCVRRNGGFKR